MSRRYSVDGRALLQRHPRHGERRICILDGIGQVAEIDGVLYVLDMVHVMGDRDGRLTIYDPDSLAVLQHIWLDTYDGLGFQGGRFLVWERRGAESVWRGWSLPDWAALGDVEARDEIIPLGTMLVHVADLAARDGEIASSLAGRAEVYPWAPPISDAERQALLPPDRPEVDAEDLRQRVRRVLDERYPAARVTGIDVAPASGALQITIATETPGLLIGRRGQTFANLKRDLSDRLEAKVFINLVEARGPARSG